MKPPNNIPRRIVQELKACNVDEVAKDAKTENCWVINTANKSRMARYVKR